MSMKKTILIVDDVELNRALLQDMLKDEYEILEAANGLEAIEHLQNASDQITLVLLDAIMPEMDGFEFLEEMNYNQWIDTIPVVMISAETSQEFIAKGYQLGAIDYISRPYSTEIVLHRVKNTILLFAKQQMLQKIVKEQIQEREDSNSLMVDVLSAVVEFRNGESGLHVKRIRIITEILLKSLKKQNKKYELTETEIAIISNAAALHDVGKIMVPEEILNKPAKLTAEEFAVIKQHSEKGAQIISNINGATQKPMIRYAYDICRWHHERWDGDGYPDGLKGEEIPLWAHVVALADVYDALVSPRVYKAAYSIQKAVGMIINGECGSFNPDLIKCLLLESLTLETQIQMYENFGNQIFDVGKISTEIMSQRDTSVSGRTISLLEQERIKYQFFAELSNEILFEYDLETDTLSFSEGAVHILKIPVKISNAVEWLNTGECISLMDYKKIYKLIKNSSPENPLIKVKCVVLVEGEQSNWFELTIRTLWSGKKGSHMSGCIGKLADINAQQVEAERLKSLAESDPLTQLYNHKTARKKVSEALLKSKISALLFFDMDNFKSVNDIYGHMMGDCVLKQLAENVLNSMGKDDIAARVGGDEFIIFLNRCENVEMLKNKVDEIYNGLQVNYDNQIFTVSVGVAIYPDNGSDYDTLFSNADKALYDCKKRGKNCYTFYEET